jgi:hypothetical protein
MTQIEWGSCPNIRAEAMRDERVLKGLWNEVRLRNQDRIARALKEGWKDRETLEKEFPTIPFEEILQKTQQEAA